MNNTPSTPPNQAPQGGNFSGGPRLPYPPQMMQAPPPRPHNTVAWVFVALITGFFLPICACAVLAASSLVGFGAIVNSIDGDSETGPAVGVIDLVGVISTGNGFGASTGRFQEQLDWMADNDDVRALVIRANSPGGGVSPSDEMWNMVQRFRQDTGKPVVVYMHGTCASGCLYVSSAADQLMASRATVVGSIGVISYFFDTSELLADIGVAVEVVETADSKDFGSFFRPLSEDERTFWQGQSELLLDIFIDVLANRPGSTLSLGDVRELATGQVWVASEALDLGLIDELGYEQDALDQAADLAGLGSNYRVQEYPYDFGFFEIFSNPGFSLDGYFAMPSTDDLMNQLQQPALQYRWMGPYESPVTGQN